MESLKESTRESITSPSIKGSSPWILIIISASGISSITSAILSVPDTWSDEVKTISKLYCSKVLIVSSESTAKITLSKLFASKALSIT